MATVIKLMSNAVCSFNHVSCTHAHVHCTCTRTYMYHVILPCLLLGEVEGHRVQSQESSGTFFHALSPLQVIVTIIIIIYFWCLFDEALRGIKITNSDLS